jgi:hypothetical protein
MPKNSTKKNSTRKNSTNNSTSVKSCSTNFCENVFPKKMKIMMDKIKNNMRKNMSAEEKKMYNKNLQANSQKEKDMLEYQKGLCNDAYCNPTCKDTLFESGDKVPKAVFTKGKKLLSLQLKNTPKLIPKATKSFNHMMTNMRQNIFGTKKNVLKNGFYEKIPSNKVKLLKKEGAISGCSMAYPFH